VNVCPFDICVSSGIVTSAIIRALSVQALPEDGPAVVAVSVPPGVPGVCAAVVDASGVDKEGVSVESDKPGLVGGSVEVTKAGGDSVSTSSETVTQEARPRLASSSKIQIFFITGDSTWEIAKRTGKLLKCRFEFQPVNSCNQGAV
jgi:hypothetical protein